MATGSLGSLTIDLAANITRFERSLTRAEQVASKRAKGIERTFKRMAVGIGAAIASFGFTRAIDDTLQFADGIGKAADRAGIATAKLQELRFAADQFGISTQQLDDGMRRFTRRLGVALDGGSFAKDFEGLGVSIRDAAGNIRDSGDVFDDVVNKMGELESQAQKSKVAAQLFGDDTGPQLALLMGQGSAAINQFSAEAARLGIILEEDLIRNAEKANDTMSILSQIIGINFKRSILELAPAVTDLAQSLIDLQTGNVGALPDWLKDVAFYAAEAALEFQDLGDWAGAVAAIIDRAVSFDLAGIKAIIAARKEQRGELEANLEAYREYLDVTSQQAETGPAAAILDTGEESPGLITGLTKSELDAELAYTDDILKQAATAHDRYIKNKIKAEQEYVTVQKSLQNSVLNNTVALLSVLGRKSKGFALAALAVQKGLAIAETIMATNVAVMKAFEFYGPTPAGYSAAANMKALGAINVGLIAATGLAQGAQIASAAGGGGGSFGSPSNPVTTVDSTLPFENSQAGTTGTLTININGVVTEEVLQDLVIPAIQDAVNDTDVILFRSDSRQALELQS